MNPTNEIKKLEEKYSINEYKGISTKPVSVISYGEIPILISASHSVKQKRNGELKSQEFYTGAIAEYLAKEVGCYVITKPYLLEVNYNDDANYEDCRCAYKTAINQFLQQNNIKLFVDIQGLSENKKSVIDICIDGGINSNNTDFPFILQKDINEYFGENSVTIDNYYKAESINVLSKWVHNTYDIPSVELEINGAYRWFESECEIQSLKLLDILYKWLKQCQNIIQPTLSFKISPCEGCTYEEQCALCDGEPECQLTNPKK